MNVGHLIRPVLWRLGLCLHTASPHVTESVEDTLERTVDIIDSVLCHLVRNDTVAVCRSYRNGNDMLGRMKRCLEDRDDFMTKACILLIDATGNIAVSARDIATHPECGLSLDMRCELETVRRGLRGIVGPDNKDVRLYNDFVSHIISIRTGDMTEKDWADNAPAYLYLRLLYGILSPGNCIRRLNVLS